LGNHDFDHGPDRLDELRGCCDFPWLLSNARLRSTGRLLGGGAESCIIERGGRRLGFIGLIEEEWLTTLAGIQREDIEFEDFAACGQRLASKLLSPKSRGGAGVDAVIAITHMRLPNDEILARACHGLISLILGGHDHHYGVSSVDGVSIFKSGTDFETLTKIDIGFVPPSREVPREPQPMAPSSPGSPVGVAELQLFPTTASPLNKWREEEKLAYVFAHERVDVLADAFAPDEALTAALAPFKAKVESLMGAALCTMAAPLDCRRETLRLGEAPAGNLVADAMLAACAPVAQIALINAGTLRADSVLGGAGSSFTMRELFTVCPMMEELFTVSVTADKLVAALENGVSRWPKKEGRFPHVAGVEFSFDPRSPPGRRVVRGSVLVGGEPLDASRVYAVASKEFISVDGKDGYDALRGCPVLCDGESQPALPTALQRYLEKVSASGESLAPQLGNRVRNLAPGPMVRSSGPETFDPGNHIVGTEDIAILDIVL